LGHIFWCIGFVRAEPFCDLSVDNHVTIGALASIVLGNITPSRLKGLEPGRGRCVATLVVAVPVPPTIPGPIFWWLPRHYTYLY